MKSNSNHKPLTFHNLGNGSWHYNYNQQEVERADESGNSEKSWDYETVLIWGIPTEKEVKKQVIAQYWDLSEEINLQNNYERFRLKLSNDVSYKEEYIDYLRKVDEIKSMVEADFGEFAGQVK